jgi:hypothetical protein
MNLTILIVTAGCGIYTAGIDSFVDCDYLNLQQDLKLLKRDI